MDQAGKQRRTRGSAWYWKQTDSWYYTPPGTKQRVRLLGLDGFPVRGVERRYEAEQALARVMVAGKWRVTAEVAPSGGPWVVARVCSEYLLDCEKRLARGAIGAEYVEGARHYLNAFVAYCGAVPVAQLKKEHVEQWLAHQSTWRSSATQRNAVTFVLSAFLHAEENFDVRHSLKGIVKPRQKPRLHSLSAEDEARLRAAAHPAFADFIFAAIQTGLRPFSELARLNGSMIQESPRGMIWKVYASKTKTTRNIPVRQEVARLVRRLLPQAGTGPIFLNHQGNPWIKPTAGKMFRAIRRSLGWELDPHKAQYCCYSCRHTFAHRMLSGYWNGGAGCSIEVLAELMGDTPKVAFDHYGREWGQSYQDPLWAAIGAT